MHYVTYVTCRSASLAHKTSGIEGYVIQSSLWQQCRQGRGPWLGSEATCSGTANHETWTRYHWNSRRAPTSASPTPRGFDTSGYELFIFWITTWSIFGMLSLWWALCHFCQTPSSLAIHFCFIRNTCMHWFKLLGKCMSQNRHLCLVSIARSRIITSRSVLVIFAIRSLYSLFEYPSRPRFFQSSETGIWTHRTSPRWTGEGTTTSMSTRCNHCNWRFQQPSTKFTWSTRKSLCDLQIFWF